ncbi:MAG: hypothetical protein JW885_08370 [Deltaproteobacteria bacterium]|nr:hypothetical protein [Candidatus Zymogenaceae bacterium]
MKLPEDIRLLLIVLATLGAVAGVAMVAVLAAPVIGRNPDVSVRLIASILLAFVTLKFFFYCAEAVLTILARRDTTGKPPPKKSVHPLLRWVSIVLAVLAMCVGWYLLLSRLIDF